jgi:hypothetical protein
MDYLLRDSHHVGVAYGRFDHYRLIDTLRILPRSSSSSEIVDSKEPALGVEEGGIQSAEAMMLARYFMFSQVYMHPVRRIYDIHLVEFLKEWMGGRFPTDIGRHLRISDNEVSAALLDAAFDSAKPGHVHARRIGCREHFKLIYERNPSHIAINPEAGANVVEALGGQFGADLFRRDRFLQGSGSPDVPVRRRNGEILSALSVSETLNRVPVVSIDYVFAERSACEAARTWLDQNVSEIIRPRREEAEDA